MFALPTKPSLRSAFLIGAAVLGLGVTGATAGTPVTVVLGYILAGTVEMKIHGMPSLLLNAGDPFLMPPGTPHNALDLGPDIGMMLSTYIVEPDRPLATFVDG